VRQAPAGQTSAGTSEKLPTVTIETTEEAPKPETKAAPQKPVVKVESDDGAPPKPAKKTAKAATPKKPGTGAAAGRVQP
jgi:hypothetical protein